MKGRRVFRLVYSSPLCSRGEEGEISSNEKDPSDLFCLSSQPYLCNSHLESTFTQIVNHCKNMARAYGGATNMHPLSLRGGGGGVHTNG